MSCLCKFVRPHIFIIFYIKFGYYILIDAGLCFFLFSTMKYLEVSQMGALKRRLWVMWCLIVPTVYSMFPHFSHMACHLFCSLLICSLLICWHVMAAFWLRIQLSVCVGCFLDGTFFQSVATVYTGDLEISPDLYGNRAEKKVG